MVSVERGGVEWRVAQKLSKPEEMMMGAQLEFKVGIGEEDDGEVREENSTEERRKPSLFPFLHRFCWGERHMCILEEHRFKSTVEQ